MTTRTAIVVLLAQLACGLLAAATGGALQSDGTYYPTPATVWRVSAGPLRLAPETTPGIAPPIEGPLSFGLGDGRTHESLTPERETGRADGKARVCVQDYPGGLRAEHRLAPGPGCLLWTVRLENLGQADVWLEVALQAKVDRREGLRFWDGYDMRPVNGPEALGRTEMSATFPATMVTDGKSSLVVGVHPDADLSYLSGTLGTDGALCFGTRLVIPAGEAASVPFVVFPLEARFGELDAIQGYYDRFPEQFRPASETDPRLAGFRGVSGNYHFLHNYTGREGTFRPELNAALGATWSDWDWGYCTLKHLGDWYGREEYWNLPAGAEDAEKIARKSKSGPLNLLDREQFHRQRRDLYRTNDLRGNSCLAFYIINFGEEELLNKEGWMDYTYPYGHGGNDTYKIKDWGPGYGMAWHILNWATPWERQYRRDLPDIVRDLHCSVFAIDIYSEYAPYRAKTDYYLPGWAYDDKGPYISTAIAQKKLVQYIHTLRREPFRVAAVGNCSIFQTSTAEWGITGSFVNSAPLDAAVWEGDPTDMISYARPNDLFPGRYLLGARPIHTSGGGYGDKIGELTFWQAMNPNEIRRAFDKYLKLRRIAYLQGGLLSSWDYARGIQGEMEFLPRLLEIQSRGFQAAPASVGPADLQRRRYGSGLQTAVVYSNPGEVAVEGEERLLAGYSHEGLPLPLDSDGAAVAFRADSEATRFPLSVGPVSSRIITTPLALSVPPGVVVTGKSRGRFAPHQIVCDLTLTCDRPVGAALRAGAPRDYGVGRITVNGRRLDAGGRLSLGPRSTRIRIVWPSLDFLASSRELCNLDLAPMSICVAPAADERVQACATMIQDWTEFYLKRRLPLQDEATTPGVPLIRIGASGDQRGVCLDGRNLTVTGRDPFDTQQLTWRLLRLWDSRREYLPVPYWTNPSTAAMLRRIGLMDEATVAGRGKPVADALLKPVPGEGDPLASGEIAFGRIAAYARDGWRATACSEYAQGNSTTEKALDGLKETFWTPGQSQAKGQWLQVDMGRELEFSRVQLDAEYLELQSAPTAFRVLASSDGEQWREIAAQAGKLVSDVYLPQAVTARHLRFELTADSPGWWAVREVLVFPRTIQTQASAAAR